MMAWTGKSTGHIVWPPRPEIPGIDSQRLAGQNQRLT